MIVAAVDYPDIYRNYWLKNIGLYAEDGIIKPFDKNRNGFVCGQGGAALVLEDFEHARKRNAHIYAEYLGGGFALESWKVTLPKIGGLFYQETIESALKKTNLKPKDIDLINSHGVATNIMDQYEAEAISAIFGEEKNQPIISAFKPYVGHNLGGCALLETAMLLLSLEHNIVPPVLNCEQIDPK
jgi:3-oxoacyl-[acyl-carrier-protein] synthase II